MKNEQLMRSQMRLMNLSPQKFSYETTKQKDFQPFKMMERPQTSKPRMQPVKTYTSPMHYETLNKREFVGHKDF